MVSTNDFVEPNVNMELGRKLTRVEDGVAGVAFFKKTGQKDCTHNCDILEPLTQAELKLLKNSDDPVKTLQEKDWVRAFCIEGIDPELKYVSKEGHVRVIFRYFEGEKVLTHVYLDGKPAMNLAWRYAYIAIYIENHLETGGTLQTAYKDFPG